MKLELTQAPASNETDLFTIMPVYGSEYAACFDIRADLKGRWLSVQYEDNEGVIPLDILDDLEEGFLTLQPKQRALIPTGFIFGIPAGFRMNLVSRSGLTWKHGIIVLNAPAVIDEDYVDETFVVVHNTSSEPFTITHGMRICQGEINPVYRVELGSLGDRVGGFGSSKLN